MSLKFFQIEKPFTRKIWKKLRGSQIPVVSDESYKNLDGIVVKTNDDLKTKAYMPSIGHGYLGTQKGVGVTRFLPVLSEIDLAVYYHICFVLSDRILENRTGVFGGWHIIPQSQKRGALSDVDNGDPVHVTTQNPETGRGYEDISATSDITAEEEALSFLQDYFSDPFTSTTWLKEWRQFYALIAELCSQSDIGNYVAQTDIANFYDSIEIPRLIKNLRRDAHDMEEYIETLEVFLGYWNRRLNGYQFSTKGIPQEILSDASRILAHYYLDDFDRRFMEYCNENELTYVRWADDFLIFGKSKKGLEAAIHKASRFLLAQGLNLNSSKTKIFLRSNFAKYRAVDVLMAINNDNKEKFRRELRKIINWNTTNEVRMDSVFRASIGYVFKLKNSAKTFEKNFLIESASTNTQLLFSVNSRQMINLLYIADDPIDFFKMIRSKILAAPYAGPRATFLHMLRKYNNELIGLGISKRLRLNTIDIIEKNSFDSKIIINICTPPVRNIIKISKN
ncbi:RNA-directed DNA polymerase [Hoeflea sp.]|uniref:RNA-directed DNA polymerase n=1 Tax=Hoeflea sp. TaxID=1940281 RepID=UPI003B014918